MVYLTSTSSAVLTQNRWTVFKGRVQTLFWPQGHMSTDQVVFHELPLGLIFQYFQFQIIAETFLSLFTIHVLYELYSVRMDNWNPVLYTYIQKVYSNWQQTGWRHVDQSRLCLHESKNHISGTNPLCHFYVCMHTWKMFSHIL